jgi:hypothetical protein
MTEEEQQLAIHWGLKAETLCRNDTFNELYDFLGDMITKQVMSSSLYDKEYREQMFTTWHGMRAFRDKLVELAITAKEILKARDADFEANIEPETD